MNYIISYPRSGNTLLRAYIEEMSGRPTNGITGKINPNDRLQKPLLKKGKNYIAHKKHHIPDLTSNDRVVLLLRDYKECVIRHNQHRGWGIEKLMEQTSGTTKNDYVSLINRSIESDALTMVVYYERLIKAPKQVMLKVASFLDFKPKEIDFNETARKALNLYPKSYTKGQKTKHHQLRLNKEDIIRWSEQVNETKYSELLKFYG